MGRPNYLNLSSTFFHGRIQAGIRPTKSNAYSGIKQQNAIDFVAYSTLKESNLKVLILFDKVVTMYNTRIYNVAFRF